MVKSTDSGISQRTETYAEAQMLLHAMPVMVLEKTGPLVKQMPKNKGVKMEFRRPRNFTPATAPLTEGVTPTSSSFGYDDVAVTLRQYGDVAEVTDVIEDTHEDPVLNDMTTLMGENIGRTIEALNYGVLRGGTNVFYGNGSARNQVNTKLTLNGQRKVTRALKAQKAMKITQILSPSPNYKTQAIEAAFVAVAHTDLEADIRNMPGFTTVAEYGQRKPICAEEIGSVEDVRYVLSSDLEAFAAAGSATLNGMASAGGTAVDVYPVLFFGRQAWGHVALRGQGAVSPSIIPSGKKTKDDPLGQRGYVGFKTWHACVRLNELWMARLEVGVDDLE